MSDPETVYESYGNKLIGAGASGSGSGGHTIQNSTGTYPADRVYLDGDTSKTVQDLLRIYKGTLNITTNSSGEYSGLITIDGYRLQGGDLLSCYVERGNYGVARRADIICYGSQGYTIRVTDSGTPVASSSVNLICIYVKTPTT